MRDDLAHDGAPESADKLADAQWSGSLVVDDLSYRIGDKEIIAGLDLRVTRPGVTVVLGPNGAGKSILLRLLHGLLEPTSGTILWNGVSIADRRVRLRQAMIFQSPVLLRRSVRANIDFARRLRNGQEATTESLLRRVNLQDRAGQPARQLSGGEQQRLALARALATQPDVLFADEPTASLDPAAVLEIETILRRTSDAGAKIILVTHDIGQARRMADEIVFLHRGRVIAHAEAAAFFDDPSDARARAYVEGRLVV